MRSAISTASSPVTPSLAGRGSAARSSCGHLGLGQVAERVRDTLRRDRLLDAGVPVPERGHAEAAGEVEVLAPVAVDDAAALGVGPPQAPLRPGTSRPSVSAAM